MNCQEERLGGPWGTYPTPVTASVHPCKGSFERSLIKNFQTHSRVLFLAEDYVSKYSIVLQGVILHAVLYAPEPDCVNPCDPSFARSLECSKGARRGVSTAAAPAVKCPAQIKETSVFVPGQALSPYRAP